MGISDQLSTMKGKKITNLFYGLGASVVILGAMFKILHLKGGGEMLAVGMSVEAFLFALSALEKPHHDYNWEIVYPELLHHKHKGHDTDHKSHKGAAIGTFPALSDEDAKKLEEGLLKLSKTANSLADVSNATLATKQFTDNITMASQSVEGLGKASKAGEEIISQSSTRFATGFNDANKGFTEAVTAAQNELSKTYKLLSEALSTEMKTISENSSSTGSSIQQINKDLISLHALYELQIRNLNEQTEQLKQQIEGNKTISTNITELTKSSKDAADAGGAYRDSTQKLKDQVAELNNIYGNMLGALSSKR